MNNPLPLETPPPALTKKSECCGNCNSKSSLEQTLADRGMTYGNFEENATVAQELKRAMRRSPRWSVLQPLPREALEIIASKISRLLSGDPKHIDSWHDIQGYAKLVEDALRKEE